MNSDQSHPESIYMSLSRNLYCGRDPYSPWAGISSFPTEARYPHTNIRLEVIDEVLIRSGATFWLEVGSMYGGSAIKTGERIKELGLSTEIVCVDPFCGDVGMWEHNLALETDSRAGYGFSFLGLETVRPTILDKFLGNVIEANLQGLILPFPVTGIVGMRLIERFLEDDKIKEGPGVIYLDSAHELDETHLEMKTAWRILKPGGILFGDDIDWVGVNHDLCRFSNEIGIPFETKEGGHWLIQKPLEYPHVPSPLLKHLIDFNVEPVTEESNIIGKNTLIEKNIDKEMKLFPNYGTDLEIQKYFEPGYSGVCVDIGAGVGTERSNTYYFEKKYWICLCIEPNPGLYNHMRMYRRLAMNLACSNYDKKEVPFQIYSANDGNQESISSLVVDQRLVDSHKGMINKVEEIKVEVKKLDTVLSRINLEKIDFVSIDTEGTELEVLMGFDINKWEPKLFVIENNFDESKFADYLDNFGYKFSQRIGVNDFFVREEKKEQKEHNGNSSQVRNLDSIFEI